MHVKLESRQDLDLPVLDFIEDMETDFRKELFGTSSVLSELSENSYSDDDILRFATDCPFPDDLPQFNSSNPWRNNSMSSRSSSSSSSFEHNVCDMDYKVGRSSLSFPLRKDEIEVGIDYTVSPIEIMLARDDMKQEPHSPVRFITGDMSNSYDVCNFYSSEEMKPGLNIPETPPITPPNKSPYLEDSPPTSPISISSIDEPSQIPNQAVITVTQMDTLGYEEAHSENNNRVPLAPKLPIKVVTTVSANEAKRKFTCSRAIKIQPKMVPLTAVQKPIIRVIENPNKFNLATLGLDSTSCAISKLPIKPSREIKNTSTCSIPVTVPLSSQSSVCSMVPEKRISNLPTIAPALNSSHKNSSLAEFRALKRQERMIKNRESASLSRKRKKEYLLGLEDEVKELKDENARLSMENETLLRRLTVMEKERNLLKASRFPVKRTSTIALMGFTFLILFNASPFVNIIRSTNVKPFGLDAPGKEPNGPQANIGDVGTEVNFHQRSLLWYPSINVGGSIKESQGNLSTVCPLHINATESLRIENELRDWFESRIDSSKADWIPHQKPLPSIKYPQSPLLKNFHPKTSAGREKTLAKRTKKAKVKEERALASTLPVPTTIPSYDYIYPQVHEKKTLQASSVGSDDGSAAHSVMSLVGNIHTLLESIERRNDTYYVVSLSSDHLLLPASSHNNSARPKMSLLVPTPRAINDPTSSLQNQISLMQIDCEVTHTQLIRVGQSSVPLNSSRYNDMNEKAQGTSQPTPHGPQPREKFSLKRNRKSRQPLSLD